MVAAVVAIGLLGMIIALVRVLVGMRVIDGWALLLVLHLPVVLCIDSKRVILFLCSL